MRYELVDATADYYTLENGTNIRIVGPTEVQRIFDDRVEHGWEYFGTTPAPGGKELLVFGRR